jgi:NADPH:quinone reductase
VVEAVRASHPGGVDAVLDVVSGASAIGHVAQVLRPGGRLLSTVYAVDPAQLAERGITAVNIVRPQGAAVLDRLSRMVEAGALWVPIQETLSLEAAAGAQEMLQHGHVRGKLVLTIA